MIPESSLFEIDNDNNKIRIESLCRVVNANNRLNFEKFLKDTNLSGTLNITNWTFEAVKALFKIYHYSNQRVTLKQGSRYLMLVQYSHEPMLDSFAEAIVSGKF